MENAIRFEKDADFFETDFFGEVIKMNNGSAYVKEDESERILWFSKNIISTNHNVKKGSVIDISLRRSLSLGKKMADALIYVGIFDVKTGKTETKSKSLK